MDSLASITHITALHLKSPYLFVGNGGRLELFDLNRGYQKETEHVLKYGWSIHGITTENEIVAIHGNRFVMVLSVPEIEASLDEEKKKVFNILSIPFNLFDWILEFRLKADYIICVVTNNKIITYNWKTRIVSETNHCPETCIIYSASILHVDSQNIIVASGTVFKKIFIWSVSKCSDEPRTLQTLTGHDGIIMALCYNFQSKTLVSASDDRSIRIWMDVDAADNTHQINQTNYKLLHVLYGHGSRIWKIAYLNHNLISFGEDSTVCIWDLSGNLINKIKDNKENSLWCAAWDENNAYYGSSNGSVNRIWMPGETKPLIRSSLTCDEEVPKVLGFISNKRLLVILDKGDTSLRNLSTISNEKIESDLNHELVNHTIVSFRSDRQEVLAGLKNGKIIRMVIEDGNVKKSIFPGHEDKILGLFYVSYHTFMSSSIKGELKLWHKFQNIKTFTMPKSKHRWANCGQMLDELNTIVVGDRNGSLIIFSDTEQKQILKSIHGDNGVTDLKVVNTLVYSSGRDGRVIQSFYNKESNLLQILRIYKIFSEMDWIGKMVFDSDKLLFVVGFISTKFTLWSEVDQKFLWNVDCGGGHRIWDFSCDDEGYHFAYIKNKKIEYCHKFRNRSNSLIKNRFHSATVNTITILGSLCDENKIYFATGSDDNLININVFDLLTNSIVLHSTLYGHISNVRTLNSHSTKEGSVILASAGGRSQILIWKIYFVDNMLISQLLINHVLWTSDGPKRKPWTKLVNDNCETQVRYTDIKLHEQNSNCYSVICACSDANIRVFLFFLKEKTLNLIQTVSNGDFCPLSMSCSSLLITTCNGGYLRFWNILPVDIENIKHLEMAVNILQPSMSQLLLDMKVLYLIRTSKEHQSGITALDVYTVEGNRYTMCTGSDDNSFKIYNLEVEENASEVKIIATSSNPDTHNSLISGTKILNNQLVITASIDQRIIIWRYLSDFESKKLEIHPFLKLLSDIPDIQSLSAHHMVHRKQWIIAACGAGCEIVKLNEESR